MSEYKDVQCKVCGKSFGDGKAAWDKAVQHAKQEHGKDEPPRD